MVADFTSPVAHFNRNHIELLSAVANLFAVALEQSRLMVTIEKENRIRQRLAQFHSRAVVDEIVRRGGGVEPEDREVSVWFCDISGFTAFAESNSPADVQKMINHFFAIAVNRIFEYSGTLDKYLGDGFMAVFGAPFAREDDAVRTINAAIALHRDIDVRNRSKSHAVKINIRSGIATGRVIAGDIGAEVRRDYTVIGDTVNIAGRLQQEVAKADEIIIDGATMAKIENNIPASFIGNMTLRGKEHPIKAFRVCPPKLQNLK